MPFHLGDAFDWAQAVIEQAAAAPAGQPTECVWCGLPLITPDENAWSLCSYCRLGEAEPTDRRSES